MFEARSGFFPSKITFKNKQQTSISDLIENIDQKVKK